MRLLLKANQLALLPSRKTPQVKRWQRVGPPVVDKGAPTYFASGSNDPGEIRGFRNVGQAVGVAAPEIKSDYPVRELAAYAGTGLPVFIDSGAFSEVELNKPDKETGDLPHPDLPPYEWAVVKPMDEAAWDHALSLYERLAPKLGAQLHVVAPDRVSDQAVTLARLRKYRDRLEGIRSHGARIIVPLQGGKRSLAQFDDAVAEVFGHRDYTVGFPSKKAATSTEDIVSYLRHRKPARVHLLGLGYNNTRKPGLLAAIKWEAPDTHVYLDSVLVRGFAVRDTKHPGDPSRGIRPHGRVLTRATDAAHDELRSGAWGATSMEVWKENGSPGLDYTDMIGEPDGWMSRGQRQALGRLHSLTRDEMKRWLNHPSEFLASTSEADGPTWSERMDETLDTAWSKFFDKATVSEKKRRAIVAAYPQMIKGRKMKVHGRMFVRVRR